MKRGVKLFFILFFMLSAYGCYSQSYIVEYFEEKYDTLDTYVSICNENAKKMQLSLSFAKEFEFGFDFPFWEKLCISSNG